MPVSEQEVYAHNTAAGDSQLVAVYPSDGSPMLDYPVIRLETGARQPEAVALYLRHGWRPDFDLEDDWEVVSYLRFTKPAPPTR